MFIVVSFPSQTKGDTARTLTLTSPGWTLTQAQRTATAKATHQRPSTSISRRTCFHAPSVSPLKFVDDTTLFGFVSDDVHSMASWSSRTYLELNAQTPVEMVADTAPSTPLITCDSPGNNVESFRQSSLRTSGGWRTSPPR